MPAPIVAGGVAALAAKLLGGAKAAGAVAGATKAATAAAGATKAAGAAAGATKAATAAKTVGTVAAKGGSAVKAGNIGANTVKTSKFMNRLKKVGNTIDDVSTGVDAANSIKSLTNQKKEREMAYNESVQLHDVDGNLTHEIIDVVTHPPLGNKDDEALQTRLWSQVAANLDTLGEMYGTSFNIAEKKKLDPVGKEDADVDNDGKVDDSDSYLMKRRKAIAKAMKKEETEVAEDKDPCWDTHKQVGMKKKGGKMVPNCVPKNESFSVKSPVSFTKPEDKIEEGVSEEQFKKYSPAILEAHWTMFENREYSHNPEKYHDSEGYDKKLERHKPKRKRSRAARMRDPETGIDSPAFKEFMRSRGM